MSEERRGDETTGRVIRFNGHLVLVAVVDDDGCVKGQCVPDCPGDDAMHGPQSPDHVGELGARG